MKESEATNSVYVSTSIKPIDGLLNRSFKWVDVVGCYVEVLQQCKAHGKLKKNPQKNKYNTSIQKQT